MCWDLHKEDQRRAVLQSGVNAAAQGTTTIRSNQGGNGDRGVGEDEQRQGGRARQGRAAMKDGL
eukprot:4241177-Amphidinium_carterae.1